MSLIAIPVVRPIPPQFQQLFNLVMVEGGYLAGGFARYYCSPLLHPARYNDIDILCLSEEQFCAISNVLQHHLGMKPERSSKLSETFSAPLSFADFVTDSIHYQEKVPTVQLIRPSRFPGSTLGEALSLFDLSVCQVALLSPEKALAHHQFIYDERHRLIRFVGFHHLYDAFYRVAKYATKGYKLPIAHQLEIWLAWEALPTEKKAELLEEAKEVY